MSLTATSTDAEVWAAYDNNASYEEDGSRTKALAFITACRIILRRRPTATKRDGNGGGLEVSFESIREEMESARRWLAANPGSARTTARHADFSNFRDEY